MRFYCNCIQCYSKFSAEKPIADAECQNLLNREITAGNIDLVTPREIQKAVTRTKYKRHRD